MTPSRAKLALQRLVLRSAGALPWTLVYRAIARVGAALITWRERGASAYVRGGVEGPDFVPGLSDVDLTIVLAEDRSRQGAAARRARARRDRMRRALPFNRLVLDWPCVYEEGELRDLAASSALTYDGLGYLGDRASLDRILMLERPGLYSATAGWHLIAGPGVQVPEPAREPQEGLIAAWLELTFWWRQLFAACAGPAGVRQADMCVKCVAEPARIWLWLTRGERIAGRDEVLRRAVEAMPEEREVLERALAVQAELPRSPDAPLAETLRGMVRISERIAALMDAEAEAAGATEVRLAGDAHGGHLPLLDWRALVCPPEPQEWFELRNGDLAEPGALQGAASTGAGPYPTWRAGNVMIRPGSPYLRTRMRAIHCRATDPVSFALAGGEPVARFPNLPGWSAADVADRAVTEHTARLRSGGQDEGLLRTAARASRFRQTVAEGDPVLELTPD